MGFFQCTGPGAMLAVLAVFGMETAFLPELCAATGSAAGGSRPQETAESKPSDPAGSGPSILLETDFGSSFDLREWELLGGGWKHDPDTAPPALRLVRKESDYAPPHRSPTHVALWNPPVEGSFEMTVDVISTHADYPHRDVCFFLGWQDPAHFYYVHLARSMDPHANQVFIVNGADRTAISAETSEGTPWDVAVHRIRIRRDIDSGEIAIWFDEGEAPVMRAVDKTFSTGRIGVGSFDDTADFFRLRVAQLPAPSKK